MTHQPVCPVRPHRGPEIGTDATLTNSIAEIRLRPRMAR